MALWYATIFDLVVLAKPFVPTLAVAAPVEVKDVEPAVETAQPKAAAVEPESEDIKEPVETVVVETATEPVAEAVEAEVAAVEQAVDAAIEAEQAVIGERIIYSIAKLLEMEPESCPMPASVVGLPVAAETTGKASNTFSTESPVKGGRGGGGGGGGSRRGDSSRSLNRSNSNYSEGGRGGGSRRGGRGGRGGHHNPHDTAPAAEDCAPLDINEETRWKPTHAKSRLDAPQDTTEASMKEAKSILNKLSIEKFEKLSNELIAVAVRSIDVLTGVIETIILKAKMEWHFATMYGELCTKMSRTQMPAVTIDDEVVEDTHKLFRRLLLKRCEQEFLEAPTREGFELLAPEEVAEKELIIKRGILGHIRFVGELFKLRMIKSRIMHQCVANLFGDTENPDEESLECLTSLLATIGQVFEMNASGESELAAIAQYYAVIKALSSSARLSTRIRFMLQDLLDLRKNKWVARRKETKAMTIAEVHAEAKREEIEKAKASASGGHGNNRVQRSQSMNATSDKRRGGGGGGASDAWKARAAGGVSTTTGSAPPSSSSSPAAVPTVDADGWETVASGKPKLLKARSNSDRFPPPSSSSVSSSPGGGRPPKSNATRGNGLQKESGGSSRGGSRRDRERSGSSSSVGGGGFNALRRGNSLTDLGRPPTSQQQSLTKSTSSTSNASDATASETETETETEMTKKQDPISAEAFEKKVKAILDEYVVTRDMEEVTACFQELGASEEHHALIAAQSLNIGLEKGNKERDAIASFLAGLHECKLLSSDAIATPLHELLEFAEDMEIDIPLTLQYIAEMIAPCVASGAVPLSRLVESVQHLAYNGKAAKVISKTLVAVDDEAKVKQLVDDAALDFLPLLAEGNRHDDGLEAFYTEAKLEFLLV